MLMEGTTNTISCKNCILMCSGNKKLSAEELEFLNKNKKEINFNKGETILKQGSFADHVVFLHSGLVKIIIEAENNKNIILDIISPGNYIGLHTLEMGDYYPFSVVALKESSVCLIKVSVIKHYLKNNPQFNSYILKQQASEFLYAYKKISVIGSRNNHGRLADTLLYLNKPELSQEEVMDHVTRKDIADIACISVESLNKILTEMRNDLIIEVDRKKITVKNKELLKLLSVIG